MFKPTGNRPIRPDIISDQLWGSQKGPFVGDGEQNSHLYVEEVHALWLRIKFNFQTWNMTENNLPKRIAVIYSAV